MKQTRELRLLQIVAITGNIFFLSWIIYNAVDNGFRGTTFQTIPTIGLMLLLSLNMVLLSQK
jgi:hypothetical protein